MDENLDEIMNRKNYFLVRHGVVLIIIVFILTAIAMDLLKIDEKSILKMVIEYYLR